MRPPKDLLDKWYKKLKASGFKDAENREGYLNEKPIIIDLVHTIRRWNKGPDLSDKQIHRLAEQKFHDKTEYYRVAGQFTYEYSFATLNDSMIWAHHAEGDTTTEIYDKLKRYKITLLEIRQTIVKLRKIMLEKMNNSVVE